MMDMGGVPSATAKTKLDMGKNNKIRAVALDFDLITKSIETHRLQEQTDKDQKEKDEAEAQASVDQVTVKPRTDVVSSIADLLGVKLGGMSPGGQNRREDGEPSGKRSKEENIKDAQDALAANDIRIKYSKKLRHKVDGGLAGIEVAKSKKEEMLSRGDAGGHFAARSLAAANTVSTSGSKWMASTGTGTLLSFLSMRSMKIALLPPTTIMTLEEQETKKQEMESLTRQLQTVKFNLLVDGVMGSGSREDNAGLLLGNIASELGTEPIATLVVSDQDSYLRSARDLGCYTCRVRRKNEPRGNITTDYTTETVEEVQDVVNALVGISFNTVFSKT